MTDLKRSVGKRVKSFLFLFIATRRREREKASIAASIVQLTFGSICFVLLILIDFRRIDFLCKKTSERTFIDWISSSFFFANIFWLFSIDDTFWSSIFVRIKYLVMRLWLLLLSSSRKTVGLKQNERKSQFSVRTFFFFLLKSAKGEEEKKRFNRSKKRIILTTRRFDIEYLFSFYQRTYRRAKVYGENVVYASQLENYLF